MKKTSLVIALLSVTMFSIGCGDNTKTEEKKTGTQTAADALDHDTHDHTAPNGGVLIDLGRNHEYHAEFVDDHKTETISIHIMDGDLKPLSIKQTSVTLVLTAGDDTQSFDLMSSQPDGSSVFSSKDEKLKTMADLDHVEGKLRVTIADKPFTGSFHLDGEDHSGHDH